VPFTRIVEPSPAPSNVVPLRGARARPRKSPAPSAELETCRNGCGKPPSAPSLVLCEDCFDEAALQWGGCDVRELSAVVLAHWDGVTAPLCDCRGFPDYFEGLLHSFGEHELAREDRDAKLRAARIQEGAEMMVLAGKLAPAPAAAPRCPPIIALDDTLFGEWRAAMAGECGDKWWKTRGYHFGHFRRHFGTLDAVGSDSRRREYNASALARCGRETLKKELGSLRAFSKWCEGRFPGFVAPEVVGPTKKQKGTRDPNRKRAEVELAPDEVERLIAALPATTSRPRRNGAPLRPVRDVVMMEWETSLRPSTIERFLKGTHFQAGSAAVFISADIDKEEFERELPLTERAREILERHASRVADGDFIFGRYQQALRGHWYKAAIAAGIDERRARKISVYDFRHAAAKRYLDASANLRGVGFLLGHKNGGSTQRYTKPDQRAAVAMLASVNADTLARACATASGGGSATGTIALDETQASDYTSASAREGGGIGRRTSLRC